MEQLSNIICNKIHYFYTAFFALTFLLFCIDINFEFFKIIYFVGFILITFLYLFSLIVLNNYLLPIFWFYLGGIVFIGIGALSFIFNSNTLTQSNININPQNLNYAFLLNAFCFFYISNFYKLIQNNKINVFAIFKKIFRTNNVAINKTILFLSFFICIYLICLLTSIIYPYNDIYFFIYPGYLLFVATMFREFSILKKFFISLLITIMFFDILLMFNKTLLFLCLISISVGLSFIKISKLNFVKYLFFLILIFIFINPFISLSRSHLQYSDNLTYSDKTKIFVDSLVAYTSNFDQTNFDIQEKIIEGNFVNTNLVNNDLYVGNTYSVFKRFLNRFNIYPIQNYLINNYNNNQPIQSLSNSLYFFIPRVIWPDKPNYSDYGKVLYSKYYNHEPDSSLASTFFAEAYANNGFKSLFLVITIFTLLIFFYEKLILYANFNNLPGVIFFLPYAYYIFMNIEGWFLISIAGPMIKLIISVVCFNYLFANFALRKDK